MFLLALEYQKTASDHGASHGGVEPGLPQLDVSLWPGQIFWLVIIFFFLYLSIAKIFAPRLRKIISYRSSTIAEALADARANRDEAEAQALEAKNERIEAQARARKIAEEAKFKSDAEIKVITALEDEKLAVELANAEALIKEAREKALSHVSQVAIDVASAMTEKLTGNSVDEKTMRQALEKNAINA